MFAVDLHNTLPMFITWVFIFVLSVFLLGSSAGVRAWRGILRFIETRTMGAKEHGECPWGTRAFKDEEQQLRRDVKDLLDSTEHFLSCVAIVAVFLTIVFGGGWQKPPPITKGYVEIIFDGICAILEYLVMMGRAAYQRISSTIESELMI